MLLILVMSLLSPLQYVILYLFPPQGMVFNGMGTDDAMYFTAIKSYEFGFQSPLIIKGDDIDGSIFYNPAFGPVYIMLPLGMIHFLFGIEPLVIFIVFKFLSSVLFLAISYFLIKNLSENKRETNITFFVFAVTAGLGGFLYMLFRLLTDPSQLLAPFSLFGFGIGVYRIIDMYYSLPFATSFLAFLLFIKNRHILSGILIGMTVLFYPLYAFVIFLTILLYAVLHKKIASILSIILISLPFAFIWAYPYIRQPMLFKEYSSMLRVLSGHNLPSIFIGFGMAALFLTYEIYRKMNPKRNLHIGKKIYLLSWLAAILLISVSQISQSYWVTMDATVNRMFMGLNLIGLLNFINSYSLLFELPFFILLSKFTLDVLAKRKSFDSKYFFIVSWFILIVFLAMAPLKYVPWVPVKISAFLALPISYIAAGGIIRFSKDSDAVIKLALISILVFSLPSLFFFYLFEQNVARSVNTEGIPKANDYFYTISDHEAMKFLQSRPFGTVLASGEIGSYIPVYSGKKTLLVGTNRSDIIYKFSEKYDNFKSFYSSSADDAKRLSIIDNYNITYIFYGAFEMEIGELNAERLEFLEKIYENGGTYIYRVKR